MAKLTIEELQVLISANADQFKGEFIKLNKQLDSLQNVATSAGKGIEKSLFPSILKANLVTAAFTKSLDILQDGIEKVGTEIGKAIDVTGKFESALIGLETVAGRKLGQQAIPLATQAAKDLANDGLMTVTDSALGLKNLLASGFNLEQATNLMNVFKDSAAFGRQSALSFGEAVSSATEGIKNGNSILVDNAGITKNLSMILTEAGYSQQDLMRATTDAGVRQALYNGLLKEGNLFQGDAARLAGTTQGQLASLGATLTNLRVTIGQFIKPIQSVVQSGLLAFFGGVQSTLNGAESSIKSAANRIAGYLLAVFRVIGMLLSRIPIIGKNFQGLANLTIKSSGSMSSLGGSTANYANAANDAAGATKKLNKELNSLASFDEMNVLTPPDAGAGAGGAGGAGDSGIPGFSGGGGMSVPGLDASEINKTADEVMAKFKGITDSVNEFLKPLREIKIFGKSLLDWFIDIAKVVGIVTIAFKFLSPVIGFVVSIIGGLLGKVELFKSIWATLYPIISGISAPILIIVGVIALLVAGIISAWQQSEEFRNSIMETWTQIQNVIGQLVAVFMEKLPQLQAAIQPLIDAIGNFLTGAFKLLGEIVIWLWFNVLKPLVDFILANIVPAFSLAIDVLTVIISVISEVVATIINLLMPILNGLWEIFKFVFNAIRDIVTFVWNNVLKPILQAFWDFLTGFVIPVLQLFFKIAQMVFEGLRNVVEAVWNRIYQAIKPVIDWINEKIMPVINKIKDGISQAFEGVRSTVENIWNGIMNTVKGAINWIIDRINSFIDGINGMLQKLDDAAGTLGINVDFRIGRIPRLATGGVVVDDTLAMLHKSSDEAVVPLEGNNGWIDRLAEKLGSKGSGEGATIVVKIGEETILEKVIELVNDKSRAENKLIFNI